MISQLRKEDRVRRKLSEELGVALHKKTLDVVEGVPHEYDLVSDDGSIIGEVKTSGDSDTGVEKTFTDSRLKAIFGDFSRDCLLLLAHTGARKRIFALTNEFVCNEFRNSEFGRSAIALGIDVKHVPA